jgi:hypothetical protein
MYRGGGQDEERSSGSENGMFLLGPQFEVGKSLSVTNVKKIRSSSAIPLLLAGNTSTVRPLSVVSTIPSVLPRGQLTVAGSDVLVLCQLCDVITHCPRINGGRSIDVGAIVNAEVSFTCTLVDWSKDSETNGSSSGGAVNLLLFGVDESRMCVLLSYVLPSEVDLTKLSWLVKGGVIEVQCALVLQLDLEHDILRVSRSDRTTVRTVQTTSLVAPLLSTEKVPVERAPVVVNVVTTSKKLVGSSRLNLVSKKRSFAGAGLSSGGAYNTPKRSHTATTVTPSTLRMGVERDLWVTESMTTSTFKLMCENERCRYVSLQNNSNVFEPRGAVLDDGKEDAALVERCARLHLFSVRVVGVQTGSNTAVLFTEQDSDAVRSAALDEFSISRVTSLLAISSSGEVDQQLINTSTFDVVLSESHTLDENAQVFYTIIRMTRCAAQT